LDHQLKLLHYIIPKNCIIQDKLFQFKIWDCSGDPKYKMLMPMFCASAKAVLVTFILKDRKEDASMVKAIDLMRDINLQVEFEQAKIKMLVGTYTTDTPVRGMLEAELQALCFQNEFIYTEVNYHNTKSIEALFNKIAMKLIDDISKEANKVNKPEKIKIENAPLETQKDSKREMTGSADVLRSSNEIEKLPLEKMNIRVESPKWMDDDSVNNCLKCKSKFNLLTRKHHCRSCGKIYCADCTSNMISLPQYGYIKPVRVCNECVGKLTGHQSKNK